MSGTVIVTGSRDWTDRVVLVRALSSAAPDLVVHGANPSGADRMAHEWCDLHGVESKPFPADWSKYGLAAGPHPGAVVLAFPLGGPGTEDCIRQAKHRAMTVRTYEPTEAACP